MRNNVQFGWMLRENVRANLRRCSNKRRCYPHWLGGMTPGRLGTHGTDGNITDPALGRPAHLLGDVFEGRKFEDGKPVSTQQREAAA